LGGFGVGGGWGVFLGPGVPGCFARVGLGGGGGGGGVGDEGSGVTVFVFVALVGGQGGRSNVFASSCGVCAILGGS
jgi:hypothetical protein